ncbi:MAG: hypothetical protein ABEK01_03875 [Candidatus Nanohaloarchaea archaeon]
MKKTGTVLIQVMQEISRMNDRTAAEIKVNRNICNARKFESLFRQFIKGTVLERMSLRFSEMQPRASCICGYEEDISRDHSGYIQCPDCGKFAEVKDTSYRIENS